jgi:hypothetical protein
MRVYFGAGYRPILSANDCKDMNYCPHCGGEVPVESVHVCYRCSESLTEFAPGQGERSLPEDADIPVPRQPFIGILDNEIANTTSKLYASKLKQVVQEYDLPPGAIPLDRTAEKIVFHIIGYGKGLMTMLLINAEESHADFEYSQEKWNEVFTWIKDTVSTREDYVEDVLREAVERDE